MRNIITPPSIMLRFKLSALVMLLALFVIPANAKEEYYLLKTFSKSSRLSEKRVFLDGRIDFSVIDSLDRLYKEDPNSYYFFNNGEKLQAFVSCTFDLFEVEAGKPTKMYLDSNKGYTCSTQPFTRLGKNYLLGGYGFWMNHVDLLRFDEIHGSWELVLTQNQPIDYAPKFVFQNSKGIYALFGSYHNPRTRLAREEVNGYFLDWEKKVWKKIDFSIEKVKVEDWLAKGPVHFLETKDYAFFITNTDLSNIGWNIIDKQKGTIFYFDSKNVDIFLSPFYEVIDNTIHYQTPNGTLRSLDLDEVINKSVKVGSITLSKKAPLKNFPWKDGFYLLLIFSMIGAYQLRKKWKNKKQEEKNQSEAADQSTQILERLLAYDGQMLNTESLDTILDLDNVPSFDSRRMKRARMITEINQLYKFKKGKELIFRDKNPEDKRFVYYRIEA